MAGNTFPTPEPALGGLAHLPYCCVSLPRGPLKAASAGGGVWWGVLRWLSPFLGTLFPQIVQRPPHSGLSSDGASLGRPCISSLGCHDRFSSWAAYTTEVDSLTALEAGCPRRRCQQGGLRLRLGGAPAALPQGLVLLVSFSAPWLVDA